MKNKTTKDTQRHMLKDIYAYLVCIITFSLLLGSGIGLVSGIANKWINPVAINTGGYYSSLENIPSNCAYEDDFESCIEQRTYEETDRFEQSKRSSASQKNEHLGMMIPMFIISLIVFSLHWKQIKD